MTSTSQRTTTADKAARRRARAADHAIVLASAFVSQAAFLRGLLAADAFRRLRVGSTTIHALREPVGRMCARHRGLYAWMQEDLRVAMAAGGDATVSMLVVGKDGGVVEGFQVVARFGTFKGQGEQGKQKERAEREGKGDKLDAKVFAKSLKLYVGALKALWPLPDGVGVVLDIDKGREESVFDDDYKLAGGEEERAGTGGLGGMGNRTVLGRAAFDGLRVEFAYCRPQ